MEGSVFSFDEFINHLKGIDATSGKLSCLNFLTITQALTLPDAIFFYDCFVALDKVK
jgi:hypothetical protein